MAEVRLGVEKTLKEMSKWREVKKIFWRKFKVTWDEEKFLTDVWDKVRNLSGEKVREVSTWWRAQIRCTNKSCQHRREEWTLAHGPAELPAFCVMNNNRILYHAQQVPEVLENIFRRTYRLDRLNMDLDTDRYGRSFSGPHNMSSNIIVITALITLTLTEMFYLQEWVGGRAWVGTHLRLPASGGGTHTFRLSHISITLQYQWPRISYTIWILMLQISEYHLTYLCSGLCEGGKNLTWVLHNTTRTLLNSYLYHSPMCW